MQNLLTVLIPTHNRPEHFRRSMSFFAANVKDANFLIADSSDDLIFEANAVSIQPVALLNKVEHLDCRGQPILDKLINALLIVKTPFVVVCGDDDFLNYRQAVECAAFLNTHDDYSHAHGRIVTFWKDKAGGKINLQEYLQMSNEEELIERLLKHYDRYLNNFYSVHRTSYFLSNIQKVTSLDMGRGLREKALAALDICQGKRKMFGELFLLRQKGHTGVDEKGARTLPDDPQDPNYFNVIGHGYQVYEKLISDALESEGNIAATHKRIIMERMAADFEKWKKKKQSRKNSNNFVKRYMSLIWNKVKQAQQNYKITNSLNTEDREFLDQASTSVSDSKRA